MAHRSPPSPEPPDDFHHGRDAAESVPDDALIQTEADLSTANQDETEEERSWRLAADRKLVEILAGENFEGERFNHLYRKLACKLTGYAWPIMMKWMSTGQVFHECKRYRRPVNQSAAEYGWTDDDRCQIATDTIIAAVDFFRDYGLRRGNWDWRRGASLATYFVGACVCCFPRAHQRWWKEQLVAQSVLLANWDNEESQVDDPLKLVADPQSDPCTVAVVRDEACRVMKQMTDPQLRQVLWLRSIGYTQAKAAHEAGLTEKAAEGRLGRYRKKLRNDMLPDSGDPDDGEQDRHEQSR